MVVKRILQSLKSLPVLITASNYSLVGKLILKHNTVVP